MARVCFFGNPYHGHTAPTLAVVRELAAHGERIIYYSTEKFEKDITRHGAIFRAYPDLGVLPRLEPIVDLSLWVLSSTEKIMASELESLRRDPPDYIIHDVSASWGSCIANALELPFAVSNPMFPMTFKAWMLARSVMPGRKWRRKSLLGFGRGCFDSWRRTRGLCSRYGLTMREASPLYKKQLQIIYTSPSIQEFTGASGDNFLFAGATSVERTESGEFDFDQLSDKPLVFVSMGTFLSANPQLVRTLIEALRGLDAQVVVALDPTVHQEAVSDAPDNFIFAGFVPQLRMLQRAALFITHAGVGSASEALFHGVPMVMLPEAFDHFLMAHKLQAEGAGLMFGEQPAPGELRQAVDAVLVDESFAANASRLGESLAATGGAVAAAERILAWSRRVAPSIVSVAS
ncbi:MAG: hypothetical protein GC160_05085 [Acidobacteria bacterium]|nr:hypothetical protein [Acidobacteriota bacterium]